MKNVYRCKYIERHDPHNDYPTQVQHTRHRVKLLDDHKLYGGNVGEICNTSPDIFFSKEHGVLVTKNSVYLFESVNS